MKNKSVKCIQAVRGQFTEGKTYPVNNEYEDTVVVNDDSGSFHHLKLKGEFFKENFSL